MNLVAHSEGKQNFYFPLLPPLSLYFSPPSPFSPFFHHAFEAIKITSVLILSAPQSTWRGGQEGFVSPEWFFIHNCLILSVLGTTTQKTEVCSNVEICVRNHRKFCDPPSKLKSNLLKKTRKIGTVAQIGCAWNSRKSKSNVFGQTFCSLISIFGTVHCEEE
jgi:hypothetical protein